MDIKECSDEELVRKMFPKPGQPDWELEVAWHEFITRFENVLIKAVRLTYRRYAPGAHLTQDVLDLVQQIFVKLSNNDYRALRELKCHKEGSVRLFLYAVATNTALDYLRAEQVARRPKIERSLSEPEFEEGDNDLQADRLYAADTNPEERYLQKEMLEQVLKVVDSESDKSMRERNRKIFKMAYVDGYTRSEIAAREGIDLERSGINSLLNRLKKKLEEFYYSSANLKEFGR